MTTTFVEICAGTGAISFALFGAKPPVPMMGSKRMLAKQILPLFALDAPPEHLVLVDAGEWGRTLSTMFGRFADHDGMVSGFEAIARVFDALAPYPDAQALFDQLRAAPPADNPVIRAATHLFLQTRTFRGKEVSPLPDQTGWRTHGFDAEYREAKSSTAGAKSRGWFNSRPVLAEKLRALAAVPWPQVTVHHCSAEAVKPIPGATVYIDPPYLDTAPYACDFPRPLIFATIHRHQVAGCTVFVSERFRLPGAHDAAVLTPTKAVQLAPAAHTEVVSIYRAR